MVSQQANKESKLLAIILPVPQRPPDGLRPLPRVGGFPAKTKIEESWYTRRAFNHINFRVENTTILPKPHVTLKEHHIHAVREDQQNPKHLGEAWVQDTHQLSTTLLNRDDSYGHYSSYYEGADGPVPDLQEARVKAQAGDFTNSHNASCFYIEGDDENNNSSTQRAVRGVPLSAEIRQSIYL